MTIQQNEIVATCNQAIRYLMLSVLSDEKADRRLLAEACQILQNGRDTARGLTTILNHKVA